MKSFSLKCLAAALVMASSTVTGAGLVLCWTTDWRLGVKWVGGALVLGAVARLVLRRRDAGMLAVRNRLVDAVLLSAVGVILVFLSESIPNQPL